MGNDAAYCLIKTKRQKKKNITTTAKKKKLNANDLSCNEFLFDSWHHARDIFSQMFTVNHF